MRNRSIVSWVLVLASCVSCGSDPEADPPLPYSGGQPPGSMEMAPPPTGGGGTAAAPTDPPPVGNAGTGSTGSDQDTDISNIAPGAGGTSPVTNPPPAAGGTGGSEQIPDPDVPADGPDPNFFLFLLFGQSNMEGVPLPEAQDRVENPRVKVLAYDNCPGLNRVYNQWYTASPPLHSCGLGVGPGDYFGKALADAYPNATIGLIPNAISGVDIDFFRKGVVSSRRGEFRIPPDNQKSSAYDLIIERARLAQQVGVIKGIIFHQGESDSGGALQAAWPGKVQGIVNDLRTDLGLGNVPFLAGELLYTGCCVGMNTTVNQLPNQITNAFAISANGLVGVDNFHFNLPGQRELGGRYGARMIQALGPNP
jgi:hypothetical protein